MSRARVRSPAYRARRLIRKARRKARRDARVDVQRASDAGTYGHEASTAFTVQS